MHACIWLKYLVELPAAQLLPRRLELFERSHPLGLGPVSPHAYRLQQMNPPYCPLHVWFFPDVYGTLLMPVPVPVPVQMY